MNKSEKLRLIESLSPETKIHDLLEELLPKVGYKDVKVTHERGNRPENGKDLIASIFDEIEDEKNWTAFVVKKGNISGTSSSIREVQDQVHDCFLYEYKNVIENLRIRVAKVKVVCNGNISGGAQDKIEENNNFDKANISFWDKDKLVKFIDKFHPGYWIEGDKIYKEYVAEFHKNINRDSKLKAIGTSDEKIKKVIQCVVAPRLTERQENEESIITNKNRDVTYLTTQEGISFITGEAGTGKSTLLKTVSKFIIEQNSLRNNIAFYPVLIDAIDIKIASYDVTSAIESYFKQDWTERLKVDTKALFKEGNFILFIDAIDEVAKEDERHRIIDEISTFHQQYPSIRIICTSRPISVFDDEHPVNYFRQYKLRNLNLHQVQEFISNYFGENELKIHRLRKSLQESEVLEKLPKTPLSLALITILFDENEIEIPATITDLYAHFTNVLLEKNLVKKTTDIIEFSIKHRIICLLAYNLHTNQEDRISHDDFKKLINKYNQDRKRSVPAEDIIDLLTRKLGILYISKSRLISFKHLSFQEYFAAYEIFHHKKEQESFLINNFNIEWWQNVSIFYGGMNKDAPVFLNSIARLDISEDVRDNMSYIAGMGRLLQALHNTPSESKINGLATSLGNVEAVITRLDVAIEKFANHPLGYLSRSTLSQIVYFYFAAQHNSITLRDEISSYYLRLLSELEQCEEDGQLVNIERRIFGLVLARMEIDRDNLELLTEFTEKRRTGDQLLTLLSYAFFKYKLGKFPKQKRKSAKMKALSKRMSKSIKSIRMTDDLTKSIKSLVSEENLFEEE